MKQGNPITGRYQVVNVYHSENVDLVYWATKKDEALEVARVDSKKDDVQRAEVFDVMARRGAVNLWVVIDGKIIVRERREKGGEEA